jgi:hypothetical protein
MLSEGLSELSTNTYHFLDNVTCPYCGDDLTQDNSNEEHVIGRRFIPKGKLDGEWNLVVRTHITCNSVKATLENDISAITLAGRVWFDSDNVEQSLISEAQRKIKGSYSRKTGKLVKDSQEEGKFEVPVGLGATMTFHVASAPQVDPSRLFELARMHVMAFFYFITFNQETKKGGFWQDGFYPVSNVHYGDWGNIQHRVFMGAVVTWEPCLVGITADGFFKIIIRRHPYEECWSWALEWNKNYRLIGFFGDRESAEAIVNTFPSLERIRKHVRLDEGDDLLFVWNDGEPNDEDA